MVQIKRPRDLSLATERVADVDTAFCSAMPKISAAIKLEHQLEAAYLDVETNNRSVAPVFQHGAAIKGKIHLSAPRGAVISFSDVELSAGTVLKKMIDQNDGLKYFEECAVKKAARVKTSLEGGRTYDLSAHRLVGGRPTKNARG